MNLELLTKLVKLANNNPNENEANSAARRVCKIIEEANFNFSNGTASTIPHTYGDVRRSENPFWQSTPQWSGKFDWEDILRKMQQEQARQAQYDNEWTRRATEEQARRDREYNEKFHQKFRNAPKWTADKKETEK